jgi:hypothetical protein
MKKLKKPNIRIVDHKDGGMSFFAEGGETENPPKLYPNPSLTWAKDVQEFVKSQDARKKAEEIAKAEAAKTANSTERFKQKPILKTGKTTASDNARVVDQQIVNPYTPEEFDYFKENNIPKELYPYYKKQLDTWKQGDIQEAANIVQRRKDVAEQAKKDIAKGLYTQAVAEDLSNAYRAFPDDANSFFDNYINPFQRVFNPLGNISGHFASNAGPINPLGLAMDVIPAALDIAGLKGTQSLFKPLAKGIKNTTTGFGKNAVRFRNNLLSNMDRRLTNFDSDISDAVSRYNRNRVTTINQPNLEQIRSAFHNRERILRPEEIELINRNGVGIRSNYVSTDNIQYNPEVFRTRENIHTNNLNQLNLDSISRPFNISDVIDNVKPKVRNRSGLTKDEVLEKANPTNKDNISKMSESQFEKTVLKPNGELEEYQNIIENPFVGKNSIYPLNNDDYVELFNSKLDTLNDIIARNNTSGIEYRVSKLQPHGVLQFETPAQTIKQNIPNIKYQELQNLNKTNKNLLEDLNYLKNNPDPNDPWYSKALDSLNKRIEKNNKLVEELKNEPEYLLQDVNIPAGKKAWGVNINPGEWEGNVEDITNKSYLRRIPGLEMNNASAGIFPDGVVRRGTKAYDSINEYLKLFNLGRVKPGFNSQTEYSKGLWENAIKSGKAVGYFNDPSTVYGSMKTIAPIIGGGLMYNYLNPSNTPQEELGGGIQLSNRMYEEGGEYELSQEEIDRLKSQGYDLELL